MSNATASITIVTYNSASFISKCLRHVLDQHHPHLEVIVVDNASTDDTLTELDPFASRIRVIRNRENVGFAAGQNQAIALSSGDWVLTLNPDVRLTPDFLSKAIAAGECDSKVGCVSGKLMRMRPDFGIPEEKIIDSTGIYFTPELRHFDRGSGNPDTGRYDEFEYVFGVTGAAALYRRSMIEDVSICGEFFDFDFFAYREDADVAWRAQLLGWKCLYAPNAVAYHVRSVLPSNRKSLAAAINMHSVKNRFLMRIKNITADVYLRHFLAITARDILVVGACLLTEWRSLPAFALVARNYGKILRKRREIMRKRRVSSQLISRWFSDDPVSLPALDIAGRDAAVARR
jgi:GT2 family glycosyltransferase